VIPPVLITSRGQSRFLDVPVGEGELGALQGYDIARPVRKRSRFRVAKAIIPINTI
jgi:hypothetical protein